MSLATILFVCIIVVAIILYITLTYFRRAKQSSRLIPDGTYFDNILYEKKGFVIELQRSEGEWEIIRPERWNVDHLKIRRLISKLVTIEIKSALPDADPMDKDFEIGLNGELTVDGSDRISITLGNICKQNEKLLYVRKTDEKGILLVDADILEILPSNFLELRNMKLFDGNSSQVTGVELFAGDKSYALIHTGKDWMLGGRIIQGDVVKKFIEKILDFKIETIMESSLKLPPKPDFYVILKIGKKTLTRNFFRIDDDYYLTLVDAKYLKVKKEDLNFIFTFK